MIINIINLKCASYLLLIKRKTYSFLLIHLDHLLTTLYHNNTKAVLDNLSNESSTNSSGFHSKSTTTIFNSEYSPRLPEPADLTSSGKVAALQN